MLDKQLIEQIVLEVLDRNGFRSGDGKPSLLVVSATDSEDDVHEMLNEHWHTICFQPTEEIPAGVKDAVFVEVGQDLLVKGAIGLTDTEESALFSKLMLAEVDVRFVLSQELEWMLTGSKEHVSPYARMLYEHYEKLQSFGVSFTNETSTIKPEVHSTQTNGGKHGPYFDEKLLTQTMLEKWNEHEIHISDQTIVTPLARDTARERNIEIITIES
ncbi:hypothetical protein [Pseudalkalibacillus sp. SCS-8]|uniref:hypothetical protein n=1 Tax=Pseudalkalibacillus nanhaiensis TaxID=3115291 RepID=UPI0032DBB3A4